jgi:hypothetical protein
LAHLSFLLAVEVVETTPTVHVQEMAVSVVAAVALPTQQT